MKLVRDIFIVARYELSDAVKSRRAAVVLLLYVVGAMLTCNGFISVLRRIEVELCKVLSLPPSSSPGAVVSVLWKSRQFSRMMRELIGDRQVVEQLMSVHPMALVYGWLIFAFTPILVMLTTSTRISEELESGSVRFVLLRTSQPAWCVGKFFGQALTIIVALMFSALGSWCLTRFRLTGMNNFAVAQGMIIYSWKAWLYSLAFIGMALGVSQLTRSPNKAMALGFGAWMAVTVLGIMSKHFVGDGWKQIWQAVHMLVPIGHRLDLWRVDLVHQVQSVAFLVCLGFVYMFAGHAFLSKRDL